MGRHTLPANGDGLYLEADTKIRFNQNSTTHDYNSGDAIGTLTVRLVETTTGGGSAYTHGDTIPVAKLNDATGTLPHSDAANQVVLEVSVPKVNKAPQLGGIANTGGNEQTPINLAQNGTISDADLIKLNGNSGDWAGASLTVERIDSLDPAGWANDLFGVIGGGTVELGADGKVYVGGTAVGTYTNGNGSLSMTFNDNATNAAVKEVLNSLTYTYDGDCPPESEITLQYTVNDGNGGTQGSGLNKTHTVQQQITINAVHDPAQPNDDTNEVSIDYAYSADCRGNVLENDTHPDIQRNFDPTRDLVVVEVGGVQIAGRTEVPGQYGTLYIESDGSYTYVADKSNPDVAALGAGESIEETFTYKAKDAGYNGIDMNGDAELVITITASGRIPPAEPPMLEEPKNPGIPDPVVPEAPGIRDSGVDKPVISTVNTAAEDSNTHLNNTINNLSNHLNESTLPPSLDSLDALRHNAWSLDEPMLFGNTDQKSANVLEAHDFNLPDDLFVHTLPNKRLIYTATLADGSELPEWMNFDPEQFCISCTPPEGSEGSVEVIIQAEDRRGLKAEATVTIKIGEEELDRFGSMAEVEGDGDAAGETENTTDGEEASETPDEDLTFAGEWLVLEAEADDDEAPAAGAHPGLRSQIDATGSTALLGEARQLLDTLIGSK